MYCTRCGKWINYEATVCNECRIAEEMAKASSAGAGANGAYHATNLNSMFNTTPYSIDPQNRMFGFGKALASTILGTVGVIFAIVAMTAGAFAPYIGWIFIVLAFPPTIISIAYGIQSISAYKRRSANGCAKPIATLVLGINGLVTGAIAAIYLLLAVIVVASMGSFYYYYY